MTAKPGLGAVQRQGRGGRAYVWVLTDEGRELAKEWSP